ncbi:MAG: hypothetical protein GC179_30695 [Anaerolineaceae bacterium]|nr:hypothetical protein [Anaerolineaceae bacterium]
MTTIEAMNAIDAYVERTGTNHAGTVNAFVMMNDSIIQEIGGMCKKANLEGRKLHRGEVRKIKKLLDWLPPGAVAGAPKPPKK